MPMPPPTTPAAKLDALRDLADRPAERAAYATRLVQQGKNPEVVLAARYAFCDANGARRDPGGTLRAALLRALRPIADADDLPLLERAVTTYEFLYGEAAGDLRAAGLLTLNQVDDELAGYHAVRLLTDEHTSTMSGEPAVTAVRLLAAQRQFLPLYAYVTRAGGTIGDVTAECLRTLTALPPSLLREVVERYRESQDEIVLLGLFDLLLAHPAGGSYRDLLIVFLRTTPLLNIYRYLVTTLVAGRHEEMIGQLRALAEVERHPGKAALLREALALR
jgi:hypothetical protein